MSNQSSVYSEKKIAAYESLFKENNFAKPQEVYLTITVAHVFGQAYILEQEGTMEGDPVYARFVCPLEEITKVYVNDKIKKPWPLFIQCDTNIKGVVHRKRIVVPCLNDPLAIADQINSIKAQHMEKYEAALEREKQRKREKLESARMKEQIESKAESKAADIIDPLPSVEKLPEVASFEDKAINDILPEKKKASTKASKAKRTESSIEDLNNALADSFKAFESLGVVPKTDIKPLPKKPKLDLDSIPDAVPFVKPVEKKVEVEPAPAEPEPVAEVTPEVPEIIEKVAPVVAEAITDESAPVAEEVQPVIEEIVSEPEIPAVVEEIIPEPEAIPEAAPVVEEVVEAVVEEVQPESVQEAVPVQTPVMVNPNGKAAELADFETAVLKLKSMKDNGLLSDEEFAAEKKKLIATLF